MVLKVLIVENNLKYKNISQHGFISHHQRGPIVRGYIFQLYTKNFVSLFQQIENDQFRITVCFSAPKLTVLKTLVLSGNTLSIKLLVYAYMLQYEDNRIRR